MYDIDLGMDLRAPKDRNVYLYGNVDGDGAIPELIKQIHGIGRDDQRLVHLFKAAGITYTPEPILLHISSYGGVIYDGLALISTMKTSKTPVDTVVTGYAMSMGLVIATQGRKRYCHALSTYMFHQLSSWGEDARKLKDIEEDLAESRRQQVVLNTLILDRTKMTKKMLDNNKRQKKDWFITADEALQLGLVDEIIG